GARDTLRLEIGMALYGNELDDKTTPIEAGLGPMIRIEKRKADFIAKDILTDPSHVKKVLTPIALEGRKAARHGDTVMNSVEEEIGTVTSGMFSPLMKKAIALAYIDADKKLDPGSRILIKGRRKNLPGEVVDLPFYKEGTLRIKLT
ncbi:MAG: hypothetical protein K9L78_00755, partial [Victivallales bacterium]|nr:hypothetical protein [Victivallales bacterium]